jgi:GNAT superfamily N-acetyltransferase
MEWKRDNYLISDDRRILDPEKIYGMLSKSYWASDRPKEKILESIDNSLCFGMYCGGQQIGFARMVTDKVFFSWIMDVIIDDTFRGKGLGKWLLECILAHPDIASTKQRLATKDAHGLYEQFGFRTEECMGRPRK